MAERPRRYFRQPLFSDPSGSVSFQTFPDSQGTDVRTERQIVWQFLIRCWKDVEPLPGTPFEAEEQLQLPSETMHSFHSTHNAVSWRLVLRGVPKRWPAFERVFPVVVFPADRPKSNGENK